MRVMDELESKYPSPVSNYIHVYMYTVHIHVYILPVTSLLYHSSYYT